MPFENTVSIPEEVIVVETGTDELPGIAETSTNVEEIATVVLSLTTGTPGVPKVVLAMVEFSLN